MHVTHHLARDGTRKQLKTHAARRDVILMPELAGALRRHRLASTFSSDTDLVFCSDTGRTIGHRNLTARGLDIDLSVDSIEHPERYPLKARH